MDQKGYVMNGLAFLLILPAILLVAVYVDMTTLGGESVGLVMQSDTTFYAAKDMERNIDVMSKKIIKDAADEITITGVPLSDSRAFLKTKLQTKMNAMAAQYKTSIGADVVSCTIISVEQSSNSKVEINSTIYVKKGTSAHIDNVSQDVSLLGQSLPDPLPFIKLKDCGGVTRDNASGRILYGTSLANYIDKINPDPKIHNYTVYINATSPLYVKLCPYEPYTEHGNTTDNNGNIVILKSCIDNKYFHESNDGACYLCRLEGKVTCSHYGIETFIVPAVANNGSVMFAPVSIDHVLFQKFPYYGKSVVYNKDTSSASDYYKLYLDNGHRLKYGLPTY